MDRWKKDKSQNNGQDKDCLKKEKAKTDQAVIEMTRMMEQNRA